ncbi:MaoC family dehydratase N-terminal domain-containing protein [Frankia sp. Cppng1_Ct_nod]|uniref:FAS1-like dehydratase domain-containing protein n=1 Tax=Frankia sp. Cppng1_Ct_nod TaxID=2897162 RepID=UPI001040E9FD|nr:MaoC family dehydratase N-terminal domain-containing protein [Frankia sp. Cppng1_Ct_nod]
MTVTTDQQAEFERASSGVFVEEDLAKDRAALGRLVASRQQEYLSTATPEAIRNFTHSYGDDNPLFCDPDHGETSRWGGQIAPPIMAAVLNAPLLGDQDPLAKGGSYRGIHAFVSGGTWTWYRPVRPGDTLYSLSGLESVETKQSEFAGSSVIRVLRDIKVNQRAEVVGVYRTLVIYTERKKARDKGKYTEIPAPSWDDAQLAALDETYAAETRQGRARLMWEDVEVGQAMGAKAKGPLTTTDMVIFHAGGYGFVPYGLKTGRRGWENRQRIPAFYVKNEYGVPDVAQRVHWDNAWAQAIGNPRAYDYGVLRECWLHHFLTDWAGDDGWVERQHDEIRKFNYQGDAQVLGGEVTGKRVEDGRALVDVAVWARNQRDEETARGAATVALPSHEHGLPVLPAVPAELSRAATEVLARHGELLRERRAR